MALQLESLYNFLILAESGSFTAAAARLYMTQQALSRQIAGLEQTLGKPLILRNQGQGQQLTPAGELLRAEAYPLLAGLNSLSLPSPESSHAPLRLAAQLGLDAGILGLFETHELAPELILPAGGHGLIEQALLKGDVDLAVLLQPPVSEGLSWASLRGSSYVIAGAAGCSGDWQSQRYIAYPTHPQNQCVWLNVWPETEWPRQIVARADLGMAIELVRHGAGCLHLPEAFLPADLKIVCPAPFCRDYAPCLVWSHHLSAPAESLRLAILQLRGQP